MKKILYVSKILMLSLSILFVGCKENNVDPFVDGFDLEDFDLVQVTNDNPNVAVFIAANNSNGIHGIRVNILPENSTVVTATNYVRNVGSDNVGRIKVNVPFPNSKIAPSGVYKVEYIVEDASGGSTSKSYLVNIANVQTETVSPCNFPNVSLPAGKNVLFRVTAPLNTNGEDIWVTGNFEQAAGGTGDWTGGGTAALKMTKVAGSNYCYYIALNLTGTSEFKITRGNWDKRVQNSNGNDIDNIKWNNEAVQNFTVGNWSDRVVLPPVTIPAGAIGTGKVTIITDITNFSSSAKYYLVKKGATSLAGAIALIPIPNSNKMAAAVPKEANAQYVVVKDMITKTSINAFGFDKAATLDGKTNPLTLIVPGFKTELSTTAVPANLFLVGDATPGGWNNPVPVPSQQFTKTAEGKFQLTLALQPKEYLMLPVNGSWSAKFGMGGQDPLAGDLIPEGANFKAPKDAGNYKIEADFTAGTFKVTKQ